MSATIHLTTKEDRRTWQALTRCAPSVDNDPELAFVCLDGARAFATDTYLVGVLEADVELPVLEDVDEETGEIGYRQPDRILLPAALLRDAIGLAKGKTHVRLRLEEDAAVVLLGDDPLPGLGEAPSVRIPYADNARFPSVERLSSHVDGDPLEIFTEHDDGTVSEAGEVVTRIGLDADRLARLSALEYRLADQVTGYVTVRPRPGSTRILEIRSVATGRKLGVLSQVRIGDETRQASTASGGGTSVTITSNTAEALAAAADRLEADEREARDDA